MICGLRSISSCHKMEISLLAIPFSDFKCRTLFHYRFIQIIIYIQNGNDNSKNSRCLNERSWSIHILSDTRPKLTIHFYIWHFENWTWSRHFGANYFNIFLPWRRFSITFLRKIIYFFRGATMEYAKLWLYENLETAQTMKKGNTWK